LVFYLKIKKFFVFSLHFSLRFDDLEEYSENFMKNDNETTINQLNNQINHQNSSLFSLAEKMDCESENADNDDEIETNNLNSSCALTILNNSSLNNSLELENEVFYEVSECDNNLNIQEATLNFLKSLNHQIIFKKKDEIQDKNEMKGFRKVRIRVDRHRCESFERKIQKRKGFEWEGEEVFLKKLKKLKV